MMHVHTRERVNRPGFDVVKIFLFKLILFKVRHSRIIITMHFRKRVPTNNSGTHQE